MWHHPEEQQAHMNLTDRSHGHGGLYWIIFYHIINITVKKSVWCPEYTEDQDRKPWPNMESRTQKRIKCYTLFCYTENKTHSSSCNAEHTHTHTLKDPYDFMFITHSVLSLLLTCLLCSLHPLVLLQLHRSISIIIAGEMGFNWTQEKSNLKSQVHREIMSCYTSDF